ncbi:MAG: efflux RND transporter periplasmic adaptor subunit [Deltaproteobacteria bacterium]|jgi:membrane fusion protein (multidrug efflux system)|nr:efflux RND transporter periplasmic adaptor subunit [Deltaproteobacteria bacterium]
MNKFFFSYFLISLSVTLLFTTSCDKSTDEQQKAPPVLVGAVKSLKQDYPLTATFPGQVTGSFEIEIRAQVGGILKERTYSEGQFVKAGAQLFLIDPEPYEIALKKAQASKSQAIAQNNRAKRDYERMKALHASGAISQKQYDDALYAYETTQANLRSAEAVVNEAQINLGYTKVTAPISGIVRKEEKSVGNLISVAGNAGLLTSMVQINPLHVNFSIPASQVTEFYDAVAKGRVSGPENSSLKVEAILPDGSTFPEVGKIIFSDSSEDSSTASVAFKAEFPNPSSSRDNTGVLDLEQKNKRSKMLPGQFVRIRLSGIILKDAVMVPSNALIKAGAKTIVYVVDEQDLVVVKPVKAMEMGNLAIVTQGLAGGETVITEGVLKVRSGEPAKAEIKEFRGSQN